MEKLPIDLLNEIVLLSKNNTFKEKYKIIKTLRNLCLVNKRFYRIFNFSVLWSVIWKEKICSLSSCDYKKDCLRVLSLDIYSCKIYTNIINRGYDKMIDKSFILFPGLQLKDLFSPNVKHCIKPLFSLDLLKSDARELLLDIAITKGDINVIIFIITNSYPTVYRKHEKRLLKFKNEEIDSLLNIIKKDQTEVTFESIYGAFGKAVKVILNKRKILPDNNILRLLAASFRTDMAIRGQLSIVKYLLKVGIEKEEIYKLICTEKRDEVISLAEFILDGREPDLLFLSLAQTHCNDKLIIYLLENGADVTFLTPGRKAKYCKLLDIKKCNYMKKDACCYYSLPYKQHCKKHYELLNSPL